MDAVILLALGLTLLAGLATGIGGALAFFTKHTNTRVLATSLGFSAGVMIYVSFMDLLWQSKVTLVENFGNLGNWWMAAAFFAGVLLALAIDRLIPSPDNPHEFQTIEKYKKKRAARLRRTGAFIALAIIIHNFPEGIATFVSGLASIKLGIIIALAIAIHNIPEGIAVSMPIYHATGSRKKAFLYSTLSGLAEPLGAILALLILLVKMIIL